MAWAQAWWGLVETSGLGNCGKITGREETLDYCRASYVQLGLYCRHGGLAIYGGKGALYDEKRDDGVAISHFFVWLGGVPVYRKQKTDIIEQMANWFDSNDNVWLGLAPEGTRSKVENWKTGFLRIAQAADVPIFMAGLDGAKKQIILG